MIKELLLYQNYDPSLEYDVIVCGTGPGGGRVAEEQSIVTLSDGSIYCVYRTIDGWPTCAYSRDGARTWTVPAYKTYTPGGRRVKHPRAANFVWKCANGQYLYWFHNHGGRFVGELGANGKDGRSQIGRASCRERV